MTIQTMEQMTLGELYLLFIASPVGTLPDGPMDGTVFLRGPLQSPAADALVRSIWHGKTFDAANSVLTNRFPTLNAISATIAIGPSLLDGADCIVLDYSHSIARLIRDELRQVDSGLYLGIAYHRRRPIVHFALTTNDMRTAAPPAQQR